MTGSPTYLKVWIWHWSRHFFNKSVTQSYIDHSRYHESKWNKIIFWLAPTLYQLQCSNCLYSKICLLCRLTYKGIVCHPFSPLTGYLHLTCVSKESASWYFVVLLSKLHPPFLNLNFIHFWKYSVTNLTCPIRPLELHFAIHVVQNHQLMSKGTLGEDKKFIPAHERPAAKGLFNQQPLRSGVRGKVSKTCCGSCLGATWACHASKNIAEIFIRIR